MGASWQIRRDIIEGVLHALGELTQREVDSLLRSAGVQADRTNTPLFYRRLASYTVVEEKHIDLPPEPKPEPLAEMKKDDEPMAEDGEETKEDGLAEEAAAEEEAAPATEEEAVAEEAAAEEAPAAEPDTEMTDAAAENGEAEA
mmetsp:Transcript_89481/g.149411  ORF Transcript_89481/g.149411 Transcript_89481/m.149411 type:complete len:144 (-) Transcript_89481:248-679(-)